jgi:hypothetical protein
MSWARHPRTPSVTITVKHARDDALGSLATIANSLTVAKQLTSQDSISFEERQLLTSKVLPELVWEAFDRIAAVEWKTAGSVQSWIDPAGRRQREKQCLKQ